MLIDLRSDTLTKPSKEMLEFMINAEVGDDVYKEDPTINKLETQIAEYFGMEEAMFFPSGTMANQTALKLHTNPGDQIICDKYSHIYNYEGGGASFNSGVSFKLIDGDNGLFNSKQLLDSINPPDFYHSPLSKLVSLENTTNKGGGSCWDFEEIKKIYNVAIDNNLKMHLDGARIWNAIIAKGYNPKDFSNYFDTISVCLSKGLGCPAGSVLLGNKTSMKNAMRIRKIFGGGMRQIGYLAAAGIYALNNNISRLVDDHNKAKEISVYINKLPFVNNVSIVETNIIIFELNNDYDDKELVKEFQLNNIKISEMGGGKLRIVTHLDYTNIMHERFLSFLKSLSYLK